MRRCPAEIAPRRYMGNAFLAGQGGGMSDNKIKKYLNSTVGTDKAAPLDKVIIYYLAVENKTDSVEYTEPGTHTIEVPFWATRVRVTACGGGGGGGESNLSYPGTGGGGGAAVLNEIYQLEDIEALTIFVGNGGNAGTASTEAKSGTATTIAELNLTLNGGGKGWLGLPNDNVGGSSGGNGGGVGGKIKTAGSDGISGSGGASDPSINKAGGGGGGSLGAGGNGAVSTGYSESSSQATAGVRGGGGGGGANKTYLAANGGDGYVKLEFLP